MDTFNINSFFFIVWSKDVYMQFYQTVEGVSLKDIFSINSISFFVV